MASSIVTAPLSSLTGVIERITFHSEESGYTVARLNTGNFNQLITIVGSFANLQAGQTLQLQGQWREHPQYGSQFQVVQYKDNTSCLSPKGSKIRIILKIKLLSLRLNKTYSK